MSTVYQKLRNPYLDRFVRQSARPVLALSFLTEAKAFKKQYDSSRRRNNRNS